MNDGINHGRLEWTEIIQVGFTLEDMAEIDPFLNWFTNRIYFGDFKDANQETITIRQPVKGRYQNIIINCNYKDKVYEIYNFYPNRISNNRFKVFISLRFPEALDRNVIWSFFRDIMIELANDYPEIRRTVINYDFMGPSKPLNEIQEEDLFCNFDKSIREDLVTDNRQSIEYTKTPRKNGPSNFAIDEKLAAIKAWDRLDKDFYPKKLQDWLDDRYGVEGGVSVVPVPTFHGWRRILKKKGYL